MTEILLAIMEALDHEKKSLSLHYNDNSYMFVNGKEIFPTQFCLGNISNGSSATESREVFLNGNMYDFSVDCKQFYW